MDREETWQMIKWRLLSMVSAVTVLLPFVVLVLVSPLPLAWFFEGGWARVEVSDGGPQASGKVDGIIHSAGLSDACTNPIPGSIIVFIDDGRRNGRVGALGLVPLGGRLAVTPMDLPESLAEWGEDSTPVTARLALAHDQGAAVLPGPVREGMYWRIRGDVTYTADLREALAIAPMSVATQSAAFLAARTQSVARNATVTVAIDIRWLAAYRGPMDLPIYCW